MLHRHVSAQTLGLARIAVFSTWGLHVLLVQSSQMATLPLALMEPIGILAWVPESIWRVLWTPAALGMLKAALLVCLTVCVLGTRWFRVAAPLSCGLLILYQGMPCSFGYVNHAEIALLYAACILAVFPSADGLSLGTVKDLAGRRANYRAAMVLVTLVFLLTYSFVAIRRLCLGGLGIFANDTILYQVGGGGVVTPTSLGLLALEQPWMLFLLRLGYPLVTFCELAAPLCLFARGFRWSWLAVMVPFHLGTGLLMGIFFPMSLVLITFFVTDLHGWVSQALSYLHAQAPSAQAPSTQAACVSDEVLVSSHIIDHYARS